MRKIILFISIMILLSSFVSASDPTDLQTGLTHYYAFDDLTDSQGSKDLTNSGATYTASGKVGSAYIYDGGDKMTQTSIIDETNVWSINMWVKHTTQSGYQRFLSQDGAPSGDDVLGRTHTAGGFYQFYLPGTPNYDLLTPTLGVYYMVTMTSDGADCKVYINDGAPTNKACTNQITENSWILGSHTSGEGWIGDIDEVGFWTVAIAGTDIEELYNGGSGITYSDIFPPPEPIPQQVINLEEVEKTTTTINISWDYVSQTTGGANISVDGSNDGYVAYPEVSYLITGLTLGTEYNITVLATNASGTNYTNSTENNILVTTSDNSNSLGFEFDGLIDNFNIWDYTLTQLEIDLLYTGGFQTPITNINITTTSIAFPELSFDVNVTMFGDWDENAECIMIDNVSWVSCTPGATTTNITSPSIFTCTATEINTGDVNLYAQCDGTVYELVNSTNVTYTITADANPDQTTNLSGTIDSTVSGFDVLITEINWSEEATCALVFNDTGVTCNSTLINDGENGVIGCVPDYAQLKDYNVGVNCNGSIYLNINSTTSQNFTLSLEYATVSTNMTTSILSFPESSFDINVDINNGGWDEAPTCQIVDNVSWISCTPPTDVISLSVNESVFVCSSDGTTGDVSFYANCSSTLFPLANSSTVVYTFKDYISIIAGATLNLPFNNTIKDFSINLVDTWMEISGVVSSPSFGISNQGINNDALSTTIDDYLRFNSSDISYSATSTMTFWANAFENYTSAGELVRSKFGRVYYDSDTAILSYSVNDTSTLKTIVYPINLTGSYNFISVVCDSSSNIMSLYINATLVNSSGSTTCTEII